MKLLEIVQHLTYHCTSDDYAIKILKMRQMWPSDDAIDDQDYSFVSTTTNPNLLFFGGWPDTGNIQFVFDLNNISKMGYNLMPAKRWEEIRIILPDNQEFLPINNKTIHHISIHGQHRYFKGWAKSQNIDFDTAHGEQQYNNLVNNELSPKGEFVGNQNPFGIIKMLANKLHIPVEDKRTSVK